MVALKIKIETFENILRIVCRRFLEIILSISWSNEYGIVCRNMVILKKRRKKETSPGSCTFTWPIGCSIRSARERQSAFWILDFLVAGRYPRWVGYALEYSRNMATTWAIGNTWVFILRLVNSCSFDENKYSYFVLESIFKCFLK